MAADCPDLTGQDAALDGEPACGGPTHFPKPFVGCFRRWKSLVVNMT
ncbi:hypothetical protein [Nocardia altamirensis]|nr:hypothetical protein [Nocardia altamirensis]